MVCIVPNDSSEQQDLMQYDLIERPAISKIQRSSQHSRVQSERFTELQTIPSKANLLVRIGIQPSRLTVSQVDGTPVCSSHAWRIMLKVPFGSEVVRDCWSGDMTRLCPWCQVPMTEWHVSRNPVARPGPEGSRSGPACPILAWPGP